MSAVDKDTFKNMRRLGRLDYAVVTKQAYKRAFCQMCKAWHSSDQGGRAPAGSTCVARYIRSRDIALMVIAFGNDGRVRAPTDKELFTAVKDAQHRKNAKKK